MIHIFSVYATYKIHIWSIYFQYMLHIKSAYDPYISSICHIQIPFMIRILSVYKTYIIHTNFIYISYISRTFLIYGSYMSYLLHICSVYEMGHFRIWNGPFSYMAIYGHIWNFLYDSYMFVLYGYRKEGRSWETGPPGHSLNPFRMGVYPLIPTSLQDTLQKIHVGLCNILI